MRSNARNRFSWAVVVLICGSRFGRSAVRAVRSVPPALGWPAGLAGADVALTAAALATVPVGCAGGGTDVAAGARGAVGPQAVSTVIVPPTNSRKAARRLAREIPEVCMCPLPGAYRLGLE